MLLAILLVLVSGVTGSVQSEESLAFLDRSIDALQHETFSFDYAQYQRSLFAQVLLRPQNITAQLSARIYLVEALYHLYLDPDYQLASFYLKVSAQLYGHPLA